MYLSFPFLSHHGNSDDGCIFITIVVNCADRAGVRLLILELDYDSKACVIS